MHNQKLARSSFLLALVFLALALLQQAPADPPPVPKAVPSKAKEKGGLVTLYALDPLAGTFSFGDGKYGGGFEPWRVYNRASDIDFNHFKAGSFSVGVEGSRRGAIIDLGSVADLPKKYGYTEPVGGGDGFASIHNQGGKVLIRKGGKGPAFQPIQENDELFGKGKGQANAPVKLGHIYLIRITDDNDNAFERVVKLLVVSYKPEESVTIRWEVLE